MTTQAHNIFNFNRKENLTADNLEKVAVQKDQNWDKEETAYIFEDGSAIIDCNGDFSIVENYGLSKDNEKR